MGKDKPPVHAAAEHLKHESPGQILHQLNQPLTAISNYAQTGHYMLDHHLPDPQHLKELFQKISEQSARCAELSRKLAAYIDSKQTGSG